MDLVRAALRLPGHGRPDAGLSLSYPLGLQLQHSPGHPPSGGIFYVIDSHASQGEDHRECPMLSVHETYPGHHLLDVSRWSLQRSCRRAVEQPIFYEGWACFAEELMRLTGYFRGLADRLPLARRRLWCAVREEVTTGA